MDQLVGTFQARGAGYGSSEGISVHLGFLILNLALMYCDFGCYFASPNNSDGTIARS